MMHGRGKSDFAIVAVKPANKAEHPAEQSAVEVTAAEPVERRAETKGNVGQQSTCRTQSRASVSQALERIRQTFAVMTRGKSRMRESRLYGSARGAPSKGRPYRDRRSFITLLGGAVSAFLCVNAAAQEGYYGVDHDKWHHGFYSNLKRNDGQGSCCNLMDCRPTAAGSRAHCSARRSQIPPYRAGCLRSPSCGFGHGAANRSLLRQQRPRNRDRLYNARPTWGWRAASEQRRVLALPTGTDCRASGPT
jgi:hypothetical protein